MSDGTTQPKFQIEKNTIQETLLISLYARKNCTEHFPQLFSDPTADRIWQRLDSDFEDIAKKMEGMTGNFNALASAQLQYAMHQEAADYLAHHPHAAIVNLGCGLDDFFSRVDNGVGRGYKVDFPAVIDLRNELLPPSERETNIPCDLNDFYWMHQVNGNEGVIFLAADVFCFLRTADVRKLLKGMSERFPGAFLVFDSCSRRGARELQASLLTSMKGALPPVTPCGPQVPFRLCLRQSHRTGPVG